MEKPQLIKMRTACARSLDRLQRESQQTLALSALASQFPYDVERKTALELQGRREDRANSEYRQKRRELFKALGIPHSNGGQHSSGGQQKLGQST